MLKQKNIYQWSSLNNIQYLCFVKGMQILCLLSRCIIQRQLLGQMSYKARCYRVLSHITKPMYCLRRQACSYASTTFLIPQTSFSNTRFILQISSEVNEVAKIKIINRVIAKKCLFG